MGHGQVEDQAPAACLILEVAAELHVNAQLACACQYVMLRADRVSGRAEQRSCARGCVVAVKVHAVFFATALNKLVVMVAGERGEYGDLQT